MVDSGWLNGRQTVVSKKMAEAAKTEKVISKKNLKKLLGGLIKQGSLAAPVRKYGEIVFQEAASVEEIVFDYANCLNAPKDYLLLNDEELFRFDPKKSQVTQSRRRFPNTVIFGCRACDVKAAELLDKFFSRNFKDPLYSGKRDSVLIIGLMCRGLEKNCFCASVNSGPYLESGFDIQLIEIDGGFFLEADSARGRDFVKKIKGLVGNADSKTRRLKQEAVERAETSKPQDFDLKKVYHNLDALDTREELWKDLSQRCQSCGGCLLLCPACSCFYVVDKKLDNHCGARMRSLDACYYEGLSRMAGGYNPINPREIMMKRKFYHKLWQQPDEFNQPGCTGCGRCNEICPGNINWLEVIKRIEKKLV